MTAGVSDDDLTSDQLRAVALVMRGASDGVDGFAAALTQARAQAGGVLIGDGLWRRIAEEMSMLETAERLDQCLERPHQLDGAAPRDDLAAKKRSSTGR